VDWQMTVRMRWEGEGAWQVPMFRTLDVSTDIFHAC
jgi:hypothetical protein